MPAKVTATQLKGRTLDEEIAENAAHVPYLRPLSQPKFRWERGLTPAERGTATHLLLQYLDFHCPPESLGERVTEMVERKLLTPEQAAAVNLGDIRRFLMSPLAEEIRRGRNVLREYPFTLLMDAGEYDQAAAGGDKILLQGVVDCCFETDAGLTVVDFKTDRVQPGEETLRRAERYRRQMKAYSGALERVLEKKVVRRALYFLSPGETVEL